jgi:hypothetical protein
MALENRWEEETRRYLAQIQTELANVDKQFGEIQERRQSLAVEAEAFRTALAVHLRRTGRQEDVGPNMREMLISQPNHKERIRRIAEQNNGRLRVGEAADILYTYQIIKSNSRMAAYRIVYGLVRVMVGDGIFEKTRPGEFRLLGTQSPLPSGRTSLANVSVKNIS